MDGAPQCNEEHLAIKITTVARVSGRVLEVRWNEIRS